MPLVIDFRDRVSIGRFIVLGVHGVNLPENRPQWKREGVIKKKGLVRKRTRDTEITQRPRMIFSLTPTFRAFVKTPGIPPTAVGGLFRSCLQRAATGSSVFYSPLTRVRAGAAREGLSTASCRQDCDAGLQNFTIIDHLYTIRGMRPKIIIYGAAVAAFLCIVFSFAAAAQTVPTPESVLGHKPGDDFYLANYNESRDYFRRLAASSNRIKLITVGKTTRGLDWEIALISSPRNLAQLDKYKDISRRLAQGRGLSDQDARTLAREGKAIVHLDGGLHSTEVAGAQHTIQLAYKLIATQGDPEIDAILDNVIVMLWPTLNPDGQNQVVAWYRKNLGTPYEVSPLPDLYQEYVGHDNNRDGYMNNMLESQEVTRAELEWNPVVFYCHHQTAPFPTRIFIPPFTEPISSNIHPLMGRWLNAFGINMAAYLDEHQMPGAVHRTGFDNWYPGFLDFTHIFRNSIAFFTETALYRYATPHFYTVDEFPKDRQALRSEVFYSSPWRGGWWRLGDALRYITGASMAVLDTTAKYRESLLYNRYQAARDNIERFRKEPPFAYVIPQEQRDLPTAATLVEKLLLTGVE